MDSLTPGRAFCWFGGSPCNGHPVPNGATCYTLCANDPTCVAAEFHVSGARCELWSGEWSDAAADSNPLYYDIVGASVNYQCHIKNSVAVAIEKLTTNPDACLAAPGGGRRRLSITDASGADADADAFDRF